MKTILTRRQIKARDKINWSFLPLFRDNNSEVYDGTQIVIKSQYGDIEDVIQLHNFKYNEYQFESQLASTGFKFYTDQAQADTYIPLKAKYLLVESAICQKGVEFEYLQAIELLDLQMRTMLNI